jgi:hypothetical protein
VIWSTFAVIYAGQQIAAWSSERKSLVTRLLAEAGLELLELMFALVALHSAAVTLARTQDDMDGVEDPAVVVVGADGSVDAVSLGGPRPS